MATIKAYTDLSQSKTLSKILPIDSADFMWEYDPDKETYWDKPTMIPIDSYIFVNDIPCWSFTALFRLLPHSAQLEKGHATELYRITLPIEYIDSDWSINPTDACYQIVMKLNEMNLI